MLIALSLAKAALAAWLSISGPSQAVPAPPDGWWGCYRPAPGALVCSYGPGFSWNVLVETPYTLSLPAVSAD